jgi:erythromycin esterase-like protein
MFRAAPPRFNPRLLTLPILLLALLASIASLTACAVRSAPPPSPQLESSIAAIREAAHPVTGGPQDYDPLMELVGDNRFVLLGEATHGTREFYRERARITRRLIEEKSFGDIAIEGDWPEAERVNRFVRGLDGAGTAEEALSGFREFPTWMWANEEFRDLVVWLRERNARLPPGDRAGVYGLDLYDLWGAADTVVGILERLDPPAAARARQRYRCFTPYRKDPHLYGRSVAAQPKRSCADRAREEWLELERWMDAERPRASPERAEDLFSLARNARVVLSGETYYRGLYRGGLSPWNERDRHMADTLDEIALHLGEGGNPPRVVVWAHNTHLGDARLSELREAGQWNLGQLMRQRHDGSTVLVGFTTYTGTVTAASAWGDHGRVKQLRPALPGSYSALFHASGVGNFLLILRGSSENLLTGPLPERAVGVVYLPLQERRHYFKGHLPRQFDAVVHLDRTEALEPLAMR